MLKNPISRSSRRLEALSGGFGMGSQVTLALLAPILITGPLVMGGARLWIMLPILGLILMVVLLQAGRAAMSSPSPILVRTDWIDRLVLIFAAYAVARYLTSPSEYVARIELLNIFAYASIFFITRYCLNRTPHALLLLFLLMITGTGIAIFSFYLRLHPDFHPYGETLHLIYAPRLTGTYGCPNHYAAFLTMTCGIALAFALFSDFSWSFRIFCFYFAGLLTIGVVFSLSRGGWLGYLAAMTALAIFAVREGRIRWIWPALMGFSGLIGFILLLIFSPGVWSRTEDVITTITDNRLSGYVRIVLARDVFRIWSDFPLFGTGPATFVHMHMRYHDAFYGSLATYSHNDYLNLLSDYGIVGFGIGIAFVVLVTMKIWKPLNPDAGLPRRVVHVSGIMAWSALLLHSTVDFNLHIPANALVLFALTGLALRPAVDSDPVRPEPSAPLPYYLTIAGMVVIASLAGFLILRTAGGFYPRWEAERRAPGRPLQITVKAVEIAAAADPKSPVPTAYLGDLYREEASQLSDPREKALTAQTAFLWYRRAALSNPLDDTITIRTAIAHDLMRRYPEAYLYYQQALKNQQHNGFFWHALGSHFWRRQMIPEALAAYKRGTQCPFGHERSRDTLALLNEAIRLQLGDKAVIPAANLFENNPPPVSEPAPDTHEELLP